MYVAALMGRSFFMGVKQMNMGQKQKIHELRGNGQSYKQIALALGISENTVKSYCRRNIKMAAETEATIIDKQIRIEEFHTICKHCQKPLVQAVKGQPKKFCSEKCRRLWWKANESRLNRKAYYSLTCSMCGVKFESYGNRNRKFCSHACYIKKRFEKEGGANDKRAV